MPPFQPLMTSQEDISNIQTVQTTVGMGKVEVAPISETIDVQTINVAELEKQQQTCPEVMAASKGKHSKATAFAPVEIDGCKILCEMTNKKPRPLLPFNMRQEIIKTLQTHIFRDSLVVPTDLSDV